MSGLTAEMVFGSSFDQTPEQMIDYRNYVFDNQVGINGEMLRSSFLPRVAFCGDDGNTEALELEDGLEPVSPFGETVMGAKLRAKTERDRRAESSGEVVREERSVEEIKRDVDGMAASAEAHRDKGRGEHDGPR